MGMKRGSLPGMERYFTFRAYSAGGVVFRQNPARALLGFSRQNCLESIEVVLVGRSQKRIWALPKGTPKAGETIEQVAIREVQEETGLQVQLIAYIGSIAYSFIRERIRYQKQVRHYLLKAIGGDLALHDQEYDLVQWFSIPEARRLLTHSNEVKILSQAAEVLQQWLPIQEED